MSNPLLSYRILFISPITDDLSHYENTPIQIYCKFYKNQKLLNQSNLPKTESFQIKKIW